MNQTKKRHTVDQSGLIKTDRVFWWTLQFFRFSISRFYYDISRYLPNCTLLILQGCGDFGKGTKNFSSWEHIGKIYHPLMLSSITSMSLQIHINIVNIDGFLNFWLYIYVLPIFFTLKPMMCRRVIINDSSMKQCWIINEKTMNHQLGNS